MAKTKDYDDYIDYTYENGIDPMDYDSYDEYIDAVIKKMSPVNYDLWERDSKKLLQSELTDFYINTKKIVSDVGRRSAKGKIKADIKERRETKDRSSRLSKNMRWQTKQKYGRVKDVPKYKKRMIKSITHKVQEGKSLNKGETKFKQSTQMSRSWELQKEFGYSRSNAMKRAAKEYKI